MNKKSKISVRLTPNQELVLKEMGESLDVSVSMLIRTIVGSWLATNEERVYRLIDRKKLEKDPNYKPQNNEINLFDDATD